MESGLCPAGTPITSVNGGGSFVRPPKIAKDLLPVEGLSGDQEAKYEDSEVIRSKQVDEWQKLAKKFEELEGRVAEQFESQPEREVHQPPVLKAPTRMTNEQWERHQTTHTLYGPACQHCVAARAVRANHPSKGRSMHIVPDDDGKLTGPTKVSYERQERRNDGD